MSNLANFRVNMEDIQGLTPPELSDAPTHVVDPSSLGFNIQENQNDALLASDLAGANPLSGTGAQQKASDAEKKERERKASSDTFMLLVLLDQINALESDLAAKYGENFAEDMFADLHQQGLIDQEDYDRIMAIKDQDERRQAIAMSIQQGLDNGTITEADLEKHPWDVREWMDPRVEREALIKMETGQVQRNEIDVQKVEGTVKDDVSKLAITGDFNTKSSHQNVELAAKVDEALEVDRGVNEAKPFQLSFPVA